MPRDDHTYLGRLICIVDAVLGVSGPVSLAELTRRTELPKPTVRRIANSLVSRDLLISTPGGYAPGVGLVVIGSRAVEQQARRLVAAPYLQELYERTRAVILLVDVRHDSHWSIVSTIVDRQAGPYTEDWPRTASDPAVLTTAVGQVVLSQRPDRAGRLLAEGVSRRTPYTRTARSELVDRLHRADCENIAIEHEQVHVGWSCLAAPIELDGPRETVLAVVGRTPRFNPVKFRAVADATARIIEADLRGRMNTAASQI